ETGRYSDSSERSPSVRTRSLRRPVRGIDLVYSESLVVVVHLCEFPRSAAVADRFCDRVLAIEPGAGAGYRFLRVLARHADDSVSVRNDQIAGIDDDAVAADRHVDHAMPLLVRPDRGNCGGPHRKPELRERVGVANAALHDDAGQAFLQRVASRHIAPLCPRVLTRAYDHEHISALGEIEGAMHHQVVARRAM